MKKRIFAKLALMLALCTLLSLVTACSPITSGRGQSGVSAGDSFGMLYSLDVSEHKDVTRFEKLDGISLPFSEKVGDRLYFYEYSEASDRTELSVYDLDREEIVFTLGEDGKVAYRAFENGCFALCSKGVCTVYDAEGHATALPYEIEDVYADISVHADILSVTAEEISYRLEKGGTLGAPFTLHLEARDDYTYQTDNYYYVFEEDSVTVYDRYLMPAYYYELPEEAVHGNVFYLTNDTLVVQYAYALPISEVDYDYMEGSSKYRLYTSLIPVLTGRPKAIETSYLFDSLFPTDGASKVLVESLSAIGLRTGSMAALATAREIVDAHLSDSKVYAVNASLGVIENLMGFFNVPTGLPYAMTDTYFTVSVPLFECVYFLDKAGKTFLTLPSDEEIVSLTSSYIVTQDTVYSSEDGSVLYRLTDLDVEAGITFYASVLDELFYTSEAGDVYRFTCPEKADESGVRHGAITERVIDGAAYDYSFDAARYGIYTTYSKTGGVCRIYDASGVLLHEASDAMSTALTFTDGMLLSRSVTENGRTQYVYYLVSLEAAKK